MQIALEYNPKINNKASGSYTTFFTNNGEKVMVARTLKEFQQLLETVEGFFRPHQSHIINLSYVRLARPQNAAGFSKEPGEGQNSGRLRHPQTWKRFVQQPRKTTQYSAPSPLAPLPIFYDLIPYA